MSNAGIEVLAHLKPYLGFGTTDGDSEQSASKGYATAVDEQLAFSI